MFVFVVGDIATQLLLPPQMNPFRPEVLTPALTTAQATLKSAVSAAGVSAFFSNDDDADLPPPGPPATVATNGVWAPGWAAPRPRSRQAAGHA